MGKDQLFGTYDSEIAQSLLMKSYKREYYFSRSWARKVFSEIENVLSHLLRLYIRNCLGDNSSWQHLNNQTEKLRD